MFYFIKINGLELKCSQKINLLRSLNQLMITQCGHNQGCMIYIQELRNKMQIQYIKFLIQRLFNYFKSRLLNKMKKTVIRDFAVNFQFIFVLISGINEIQIYSLYLKNKFRLNQTQIMLKKNILIIIIIRTYYILNVITQNNCRLCQLIEYHLSIQVTEQQRVQLLLSIFTSTLFVVFRTVTNKGIQNLENLIVIKLKKYQKKQLNYLTTLCEC
ncbi:unnamed protein product [Paramecium sonneborni]|uniref:Transmembrane protein n=1 Tax=Paramecium sonneborni TaxID=65129 RepID=A0A8S1QS69_9CILI|nr:unnamed protein product [Paramecium sonneborni]